MKPIIDMRRYNKQYEYFYYGDNGELIRAIGTPTGMGGSICLKVLSNRGAEIYAKLKQFAAGRAPKFNGLSRRTIYFKWVLHEDSPTGRDQLLVAADWVRDLGYEVVVEVVENKTIMIPDKSKPKRGETDIPGGRTWWQRKEVPCTYVKLTITHPKELKL